VGQVEVRLIHAVAKAGVVLVVIEPPQALLVAVHQQNPN
jgi:hypothetical protein